MSRWAGARASGRSKGRMSAGYTDGSADRGTRKSSAGARLHARVPPGVFRQGSLRWGFLAVERDGEHIGCAGFKDARDGGAEAWYYIGDEEWRGRGIGRLLVAFTRGNLGLRRISARILETYLASRKVHEANGFVRMDEGFGSRGGCPILRYQAELA